MIEIDISCETCGDGLVIVREWTDSGCLHFTVGPCEYCNEELPAAAALLADAGEKGEEE